MLHLYAILVEGDAPLLKYLPMYKFPKDHLELFFSNIIIIQQFKSVYKKLLVKSEIKHSKSSNCIALSDAIP